ncbi:uncharacterized protein YKR011C [Kluyveromyces marxianus]|uniref:Uncharacterized protein YKR011C n=2 Tax=Kluyveromyces marxianus TaxID=4911 RepID=W0T8M7_KLUMD|nr:uncharacterized protein KLMA_30475 [Kluyveromyces marxianus DMKU3-1042]QGN15485.1 YKR011C [Kluyveromyces marxianus]BAO39770.1 uncharacterized protein YKR011C [Kluyveromyces marxianus DMKU3-1042]BAP71254.1 uncharacterized protein YKR011C [Kluyveromyces marxianus]
MDKIYVYAGENKAKIELTRIKDVPRIEDIIEYLHRMQDIFQLQLGVVETITGNLKIRSSSQHDDSEDYGKPFYILEYCEGEDRYSLWRTSYEWKLSGAIATLYGNNGPVEFPVALLDAFKNFKHKEEILNSLKEFNIKKAKALDWQMVAVELSKFIDDFEKSSSEIDRHQLKTAIALTLLKCMVHSNKIALENTLLSYDAKMHQQESNVSSPSSTSTKPTRATSVESDYTHMPSTQLQSNFNSFFQSMAENFETYDTEKQPSTRSLKLPPLTKVRSNSNKRNPAGQVEKPTKKKSRRMSIK